MENISVEPLDLTSMGNILMFNSGEGNFEKFNNYVRITRETVF